MVRPRYRRRVSRSVLFIYNDPTAPEALLGDVFTDAGFDIETFNVVPAGHVDDPAGRSATFPDPLRYDVIVPLGSRWSVYDDALRRGWVGAEMTMVRDATAAGVGVLGVCFGGQLVAQALGGTVGRSPQPELGWHLIDSVATDFIPSGPWFQWHSDRWTTPPGATELARNANAPQAFSFGSALALQFHPELDAALLECWIDNDSTDDITRFGIDPDQLRAQTANEAADARGRLATLVSGFLDRVARSGSVR